MVNHQLAVGADLDLRRDDKRLSRLASCHNNEGWLEHMHASRTRHDCEGLLGHSCHVGGRGGLRPPSARVMMGKSVAQIIM